MLTSLALAGKDKNLIMLYIFDYMSMSARVLDRARWLFNSPVMMLERILMLMMQITYLE